MTKRVTTNTAAVIAVHLYGHPCDMDAVLSVAKQHDLKVIEDCAQAHGAEYKGKRVGSLGHAGAFSFYPGKNLGAYGDGGAIVTNNSAMAKRCRMLANHGRSKKYDHEFEGRNSRLDGLQAAILSIKLKHLDVWTERRIAVADLYLNALKDIEGLILPVREAWAKQVYHLFVIRTAKRDALKAYLQENGVQTGVHYPISLPKLNAYTYCNQMHEPMVANEYDEMLLSLPIGEHLSDDDVHQVVDLVKRFFV